MLTRTRLWRVLQTLYELGGVNIGFTMVFGTANLFECLVVDKARGILGNLELLPLNILAELPTNWEWSDLAN
jgi:hypothetical protein